MFESRSDWFSLTHAGIVGTAATVAAVVEPHPNPVVFLAIIGLVSKLSGLMLARAWPRPVRVPFEPHTQEQKLTALQADMRESLRALANVTAAIQAEVDLTVEHLNRRLDKLNSLHEPTRDLPPRDTPI